MSDKQFSLFIWYNANELVMDELKAWLKLVKQQTGLKGKLYVRRKDGRTTYMETYKHVSGAAAIAIEDLAASCSLFTNIERRCESFHRIDKV